jgi:hypothetical protein
MRYRWRLFAAGAALAAVGVAALTSGHALAITAASKAPSTATQPAKNGTVLSARLAPSQPTDPPIFGAAAGGVGWSIQRGNVVLRQGGQLDVNVDALIVTSLGSNPVPGLAASVYCSGMLAATTAPVPFSTKGDAVIDTTVSLPALCAAPAVLLNPAVGSPLVAKPAIYIGFDGTR